MGSARHAPPSNLFEQAAARLGATRIAGVDEAGRGPLAGPVVAAAVVLRTSAVLPGLHDSKLLSSSARDVLYDLVRQGAEAMGVGVIGPETIDEINILQATRLAMLQALRQIDPLPDHVLIDGPLSLDIDLPQQAIVKGDRLSVSVAAAAIVAKVTRDRIMAELDEQYPCYGFSSNKGYGTADHRQAIARFGPCPVHRKQFKGVKEYLGLPLFQV